MRITGHEGLHTPDTVSVTLTQRDGLVVTCGSDGTVVMRWATTTRVGVPQAAREEASRTVLSRGTVVRRMRDGSSVVLLADGAVMRKNEGESRYVGGGMTDLPPTPADHS